MNYSKLKLLFSIFFCLLIYGCTESTNEEDLDETIISAKQKELNDIRNRALEEVGKINVYKNFKEILGEGFDVNAIALSDAAQNTSCVDYMSNECGSVNFVQKIYEFENGVAPYHGCKMWVVFDVGRCNGQLIMNYVSTGFALYNDPDCKKLDEDSDTNPNILIDLSNQLMTKAIIKESLAVFPDGILPYCEDNTYSPAVTLARSSCAKVCKRKIGESEFYYPFECGYGCCLSSYATCFNSSYQPIIVETSPPKPTGPCEITRPKCFRGWESFSGCGMRCKSLITTN